MALLGGSIVLYIMMKIRFAGEGRIMATRRINRNTSSSPAVEKLLCGRYNKSLYHIHVTTT